MPVKRKIRPDREAKISLRGVGRRIRQVRGFDMTQREFARRLRISQSQLSKYERGLMAPTAECLIRLKEQFEISIDWVLTGNS
ncbi:MAG: helix-turn-helix domain-containing protein [Dehalococcoidia bacterium]